VHFIFVFIQPEKCRYCKKANKEALATLNGYSAALQEHDISKAISYLSKTKDFLAYDNGKAMNCEEFTAAIKTAFTQIKKTVVRYDTFYVRNIVENAVLITGSFHQNVTDANNKEFDFDVTASFVVIKGDGEWKLTYSTVVSRLVSN